MSQLTQYLRDTDYRTAPFFAVLDGAQFENLPDMLRENGYRARSLYLDRGDNHPERMITAPHLVTLDETVRNPAGRSVSETVPTLVELIGDAPAAVFWQCPQGEDALFQHLRGLNMVLYPREMLPEEADLTDNDEGTDDPFETRTSINEQGEKGTYELVLFRHADANVMAQMAPILTEDQRARLLGPATVILFDASRERGGFHQLQRPERAIAPPGPLRLEVSTLNALDDGNLAVSRRRIEAHLREVGPEYVDAMQPEAFRDLVFRSEQTGDRLGIESEYGHGMWATLMLMTNGEIADDPDVIGHITSHPGGADHAAEEILQQLGNASDEDWDAV